MICINLIKSEDVSSFTLELVFTLLFMCVVCWDLFRDNVACERNILFNIEIYTYVLTLVYYLNFYNLFSFREATDMTSVYYTAVTLCYQLS